MVNLELVQNYVVNNENKTIKEVVEKKHAGFENGWEVKGDMVEFWFSPTVKLENSPLTAPAKYKWEVRDTKITPINGKAIELTPELDERLIEFQKRRDSISKEELEIYDLISKLYGEEEDDNEYQITFGKVAKQYEMTPKEVEELYFKVNEKLGVI